MTLNIAGMIAYGRCLIGIMEGDSDPQTFIPEVVFAHRAGRFPFDRLVRTFRLADTHEAIVAPGRGECVKLVPIP